MQGSVEDLGAPAVRVVARRPRQFRDLIEHSIERTLKPAP
jgi:hypothetical protein